MHYRGKMRYRGTFFRTNSAPITQEVVYIFRFSRAPNFVANLPFVLPTDKNLACRLNFLMSQWLGSPLFNVP